MSLRPLAGADLLAAPAILPGRPVDPDVDPDVDRELLDLLCQDSGWVDETFREIVAASWAEPPRGGAVRPAARPRREGTPGRRTERASTAARSLWVACAQGRQRSPPPVA